MFKVVQRQPQSLVFADETPASSSRVAYDPYAMDVDEASGFGEESARRTTVSPGEVITSSKEYMR